MDTLGPAADIVVVGAGRLGRALAQGLLQAGLPLRGLVGRTPEALSGFPSSLQLPHRALNQLPGVIFLTVPDDRLCEVAGALPVDHRHTVVHCSGVRSLSVLAACADQGARVACFHPLQAFPYGSDGQRFQGIAVGIEGDDATFGLLSRWTTALGATAFDLRGIDRARYHAAAVFASNYAVALMQAATDAWTLSGLPKDAARAALAPLMAGAVSALSAAPLDQALTGPLARGDLETLRAHLQALAADAPLQQTYVDLARMLTRLQLPADAAIREQLAALLAGLPPDR